MATPILFRDCLPRRAFVLSQVSSFEPWNVAVDLSMRHDAVRLPRSRKNRPRCLHPCASKACTVYCNCNCQSPYQSPPVTAAIRSCWRHSRRPDKQKIGTDVTATEARGLAGSGRRFGSTIVASPGISPRQQLSIAMANPASSTDIWLWPNITYPWAMKRNFLAFDRYLGKMMVSLTKPLSFFVWQLRDVRFLWKLKNNRKLKWTNHRAV